MPRGSQSLISDLFKTVSQIRESITHTHHNPSITTPSTIPPTSTDTTNTSTTNPPNATPNASANNTPTTTPTIITNTPKIKGTSTSLRQQTLTLTKNIPESTSSSASTNITPPHRRFQPTIPPASSTQKRRTPRNPYKKKYTKKTFQQTTINVAQEQDFNWIGTKICKKPQQFVRFWCQNRNGINRWRHYKHFAEEIQTLQNIEVQYVSYTETNLNAHNSYIKDQLNSVIEEVSPSSHIQLSSTNVSHASESLQFGGTFSLAQGNLATRFTTKGTDKFGRYSWMLFSGKKSQLKVYTIYRPVLQTDNSAGDGTVWAQHREILLKHSIKTNPRQHILETLSDDISKDRDHNRQILVMGDFNENILDDSLNNFFSANSLTNVISHLIPDLPTCRSYYRGRYLIDGIWATPQVCNAIRNLGIAPFYYKVPSDHRAMYFDVNIHQILDAHNSNMTAPPYRRLKSTIPKRTKEYTTKLAELWFLYNIKMKIDTIEYMIESEGATEKNLTILNNLDTKISEIMSHSEKKCCNIGRHAKHSWSTEFGKTLTKERNLKCSVSREFMKSSFKFSTPTIKKLFQDLKTTRRYFKHVKKHDDSFRDRHMDDRASDFVRKHPHMKHGGVVKMIHNAEKQSRVAAKINKTLNGYREGALSHVLIPALEEYSEEVRSHPEFNHTSMQFIWPRVNTKNNGRDINNWETIDQREKVEELTLQVLKCHFAQANGSPLTTDEWIEKLNSEEVQNQIQDGTFDTSKLSKSLQLYFSELERPNVIKKDLPFHYSFEDFCSFIQNSDETTSASPSGRHYGHYKVLLTDLKGVFHDIYRIMNLCIKHGIILERYKKTVTTLICKEKNKKPLIHRLRPLHLIEIELQAISKSQWAKQLLKNAERHNLVADSQYGGRANKQAQSLILNKTLVYDINRHLAKDFSSVDEDLKACYDRELAHLGAVEDRYYGNTYQHGKFLTETTKGQNFFVKMKFGISDTSYQYTNEEKVWGLGQGIGWSGSRWTLTSSTIDRCMQKTCNGLLLRSPDNTVKVQKMLAMFVNDLAQLCNVHPNYSVLDKTYHNVQTHADLVYVTGGSLALPKCKFYLVEFYFDQDGDVHVFRKDQRPSQLTIRDPVDGKLIKLQHFDPFTSHDNLGYKINPMGDMADLFRFILGHVTDWATKVDNSTLWPEELIESYHANLKPSITYRLAGATFTYHDCDVLMKIIYPLLLRAHQLPSTFPRAIASAPFTYAGLQIEHIYDIMGKEKLKFLMMHIKKNDTTGQLIFIAMQCIQITLGTSKPFYELNYDKYEHLLQASWIKHLWQYMDSRSIEIELTKKCTFTTQRKSDQFLMDILRPHFSTPQLNKINKIRQHLKVLQLSDVTDITGKYILPNIKNGINFRKLSYGWPHQPMVAKFLPLWKNACQRLQIALNNRPLGQWTNISQSFQWASNSSGSIISNASSTYHRYVTNGQRRYKKVTDTPSILPYPADVHIVRNKPRFLAALTDTIIPPHAPTNEPTYKKFFGEMTLPHSLEKKLQN